MILPLLLLLLLQAPFCKHYLFRLGILLSNLCENIEKKIIESSHEVLGGIQTIAINANTNRKGKK